MRTLFSATDRLYQTTQKPFLVVECEGCRLMRLYPQPTPLELHEYYPSDYWFSPSEDKVTKLAEFYRKFVLMDHVRFVTKALANAGSEEGLLLDVGCGGGLFLHLMRERGVKGMGLDFSLAAAAVALQRFDIPVVCATLSKAPIADESCKVITMFHVLEHLFDPLAYLQAAHKLLEPEGRLVVQVPNAACWQFLILGKDWNGIDVPRHLINFRASELEALLDFAGFEVTRRKYFSLRDNPAGLATSIAPNLDPMARHVRGIKETAGWKLAKDLGYLGLVIAALPLTAFEAACRAGSTVMFEARKKKP
jgi:2-polyprenyl-3-methyl-5-hydroxy-6-metoxy-1,4-benzoquinol methylase